MNIKEIAEMAGVSRATVSRYLNDGYVSDEKKEKIRKVIEETGYIPSTQAQMLRTRKAMLMAVIVPQIDSEYVSKILDGIDSVLAKDDYRILLVSTNRNPQKELDYLNIFSNHRVDGVILIASCVSEMQNLYIQKLDIPVVVLGQEYEEGSCVYYDEYHAGKAIAECMLEKRREQLAYFGVTTKNTACGIQRRDGVFDTLEEQGIDVESMYKTICDFSVESAYDEMKQALEAGHVFKGVICADDDLAVGAIKALMEAGYRVPEDVSVVGVGNKDVAELITPALTTIGYHYEICGRETAKMLLSLLREEQIYSKKLMLDYEVIRRESL